jgi:NAD(P)-dependent dehydrogenase (short-subunit alcohol dehydrogenase family)
LSGREYLESLYGLEDRVAVVTGGSGALGSGMAMALARAGASVCILSRNIDKGRTVVSGIEGQGGEAMAVAADVLDRDSLLDARKAVLDRWGRLTTLVNAAGGNRADATVSEGAKLFDMPVAAFEDVLRLNLTGSLLPSLVFGEAIVESGGGSIVNVSSMSATRALTRVGGYGAAKAAVESLTRWLAVELGRRHGDSIRVNAIAPGFFVGEQNRALLLEPDGALTRRGAAVIEHTPAGRFGVPEDLAGALVWLCGPGARFVNGVVIPVDGGFSAFSGV